MAAALTGPQQAALEAIAGHVHGRSAASVARRVGHSSPSRAAQVLDRLVDLGLAHTWQSPSGRRWSAPEAGPTLADTMNEPNTHARPEREA